MGFQIGDKVSFLDDVGGGLVISLLKDGYVKILTDDGFENLYASSTLVLKASKQDYQLDLDDHEMTLKSNLMYDDDDLRISRPKRINDYWHLDLHIEELVSSHRTKETWEIIDIQIQTFTNFLHEAMNKRMNKLVVIHGVGEGILRSEIRSILNGYPNIEYFDASYQDFGMGGTEIRIRYKL